MPFALTCPPDLRWRRVPILSGHTAIKLLHAEPGEHEVSLDLGLTRELVVVQANRIVLPDGTSVRKDDLEAAFSALEDCLDLTGGRCRKVYIYSESERKYYKLFQPFENRAPTIIINNATMHSIIGKDPWQYQVEKVATLPKLGGSCLDTCCGLGYSAQLLAERGFTEVITCEIDDNVLRIAAINPWSEKLYHTPGITILRTDVRDYLATCHDSHFACVFHDPPTVLQAGELYSQELYRRFARVLRPGGVLYHYVGAPGGRLGRDYAAGVIRRLHDAGFTAVRRVNEGVIGRRA